METFHEKFVAPKCRITLWEPIYDLYMGFFDFLLVIQPLILRSTRHEQKEENKNE